MARKSDRPNVLFIMSDQHRHDYMGCSGSDFVRTPNLDRIAERGVRFTNCVTNSPVCAPARIALASGLMPSRLGSVGNDSYLPISTPTYYQRMRDHGYRVGHVGKLDLAKPDPYNGRFGDRPCNFGWGFTHPEECEGKMHAGKSPTPQGPYNYYLEEKGLLQKFHEDYTLRSKESWALSCHDAVLDTEDYEDGYIGRRAAEWLANTPDDFPWHYFVSFVGPHDPFDPPTEYADRYRDAEMPTAIPSSPDGKPTYYARRQVKASPEKVTETRRQYCAEIELIDDYVGEMLAALEKRGQLDNTFIVYSSDHGEMLGDHGTYTKSLPYEAAIRVPLIVAGPGIEGGRVSDTMVELFDANPTICDLAGLPAQENIDARSLGPVLRGETETHRESAVSQLRNFRCIRTQKHKLVENYNDVLEFYDLEKDPNEQTNIAEGNGEITNPLKKQMAKRFTEEKWRR